MAHDCTVVRHKYRAANRQKWMKFCREKINWTPDPYKTAFFADEAMVMIENDQ